MKRNSVTPTRLLELNGLQTATSYTFVVLRFMLSQIYLHSTFHNSQLYKKNNNSTLLTSPFLACHIYQLCKNIVYIETI